MLRWGLRHNAMAQIEHKRPAGQAIQDGFRRCVQGLTTGNQKNWIEVPLDRHTWLQLFRGPFQWYSGIQG